MNKNEMVLACMAAGGKSPHQPVQIQKLIFIFQQKAKGEIGEPVFDFFPYDYGPFEPSIYQSLEELAVIGQVQIIGEPFSRNRAYSLTEVGLRVGSGILLTLPQQAREFLQRLSAWVRSLSFVELVAAVYAAYPEMKRRSIFRG